VVSAEAAQRKFVQTLSKTFAQLSTGLAIFDRQMQLVLFNPALVDLTGLQADFLSMRPNLLTFFDRLRDGRVMPEPKNYSSWREQMSSLVAAASEGSYEEVWTLPSGCTYRVSGRPHPDGAIAFLFEDISAEITLTRRFRSELDLCQSILNRMDDAIAVFSASGTLTNTNAAFRNLWKMDDTQQFAEMTVINAMRIWQEIGGANPLWDELRDFVLGREDRTIWSSEFHHADKGAMLCRIYPIENNATMVVMSDSRKLHGKSLKRELVRASS
jgi:PAS domain-containing protein